MKIAVTAAGPDLDSPVDPRFGRARYLLVVDEETGRVEAVDNSVNLAAAQGAGIQAGRRVVELGVAILLTGHVGPKAFATLCAGGVRVRLGAAGTVAGTLARFRAGELVEAAGADVEGHWT